MQRKLSQSEIAELGDVLNRLDKAAEIVGCNDARQYFPDAVDMLANMRIHGTSDGKPWVEPEPEVVIDDKWAAVWPRRWVMCRDDGIQSWKGPYRLLGFDSRLTWPYCCDVSPFKQCRPATAEEIAGVEPAGPAENTATNGLQQVREAIHDRLAAQDRQDRSLDWNIGFIDGLEFALEKIQSVELKRLKERT